MSLLILSRSGDLFFFKFARTVVSPSLVNGGGVVCGGGLMGSDSSNNLMSPSATYYQAWHGWSGAK